MPSVVPIPGLYQPFSSLSHLLGACVFAVASVWLLRQGRGNLPRMISLFVFCLGAVVLLAISGAYHLLDPAGEARAIVRRLDHAAIFVLIASTFTPANMILFRGWKRTGMLLLVWLIAFVGIGLKMFYFHQISPELGIALYLGMGWLGIYPCFLLWRRYGFQLIQPVLLGGLAYTVGAVLEGLNWPILVTGVVHSHEMLHVAVLLGLTCHWAFIYQIADGRVAPL